MAYERPDRDRITSSFQSTLHTVLDHVPDPTTQEKRQHIYMREPDVAADDFDGYPYAYLEDYSVQMSSATMNGHRFNIPATATIIVDAEDEDAETKMQFDELSDAIISQFMVHERYEMEGFGWTGIEIDRNNRVTTITQEAKPIMRRTIEFGFNLLVDFNG